MTYHCTHQHPVQCMVHRTLLCHHNIISHTGLNKRYIYFVNIAGLGNLGKYEKDGGKSEKIGKEIYMNQNCTGEIHV